MATRKATKKQTAKRAPKASARLRKSPLNQSTRRHRDLRQEVQQLLGAGRRASPVSEDRTTANELVEASRQTETPVAVATMDIGSQLLTPGVTTTETLKVEVDADKIINDVYARIRADLANDVLPTDLSMAGGGELIVSPMERASTDLANTMLITDTLLTELAKKIEPVLISEGKDNQVRALTSLPAVCGAPAVDFLLARANQAESLNNMLRLLIERVSC